MNYELSFLTPVLDSEKRGELLREIEEKIVKTKGKVEDRFIEKKFFAYPVKKHQEGFLAQVNFSLDQEELKNFQDYLKKKKEILRTLLEKKGKPPKELPEVKKRKPSLKVPPKREKVKIEELEKKLKEILK